MFVRKVGAVSVLALLAGVSAAALAQAPGGGQSQGGAEERMQTPGQGKQLEPGQKQTTPGKQREPDQQMAPGRGGGEQAQTPERGQGKEAQEPGTKQGKQAQEPTGKQPKQAQQPGRKQQQQAEQPEGMQPGQAKQPEGKHRQKAEQPQDKQRQRAEEPARDKQQRQRAEEPARDKQQRQQAEEPATGKQKQQAGRQGEGRVQLNEEQRTTVREHIRASGDLDRARVADVNFSISVGTRVPRDRVRLAPLPTVIVEEVPAYRGYQYFVVRDELVIIDPRTYVIVDVIRMDGAPGRAASRGRAGQTQVRLSLSPQERQIVLSSIDREPSVRLGIGDISVGMEVPRQVELRPFPQTVIEEVPELRSYRYFVFEQEVAIVDPQQRQVVLTISE